MENEVRDNNRSTIKKHELVLSEQELDKVTVFTDRAEVVRFVEVEFDVGLNEVRLTNAPAEVDSKGMRVEGKGDATIVEVSLQDHCVPQKTPVDSEDLKKLRNDVQKLDKEEQAVSAHISRTMIKEAMLNNHAQTVSKSFSEGKWSSAKDGQIGNEPAIMKDDSIQTLIKFLDSVHSANAAIDSELFNAKAERASLQEKKEALRRNIRKLEMETERNEVQDIVVLIDARKAGKVRLRVSYLVHGANWSATYDVRASSVDTSVQIHYFAMVSQTSGEDWNDVQLVLSTAKPAISGQLPTLGTRFVKFREPIRYQSAPQPAYSQDFLASVELCAFKPMGSRTARAKKNDNGEDPEPDMTHEAANVSSDQFNTAFIIARRATIPSNGTERKVTIGIVNAEAELVHKIVPRKSLSAYITAKVRNSSNMALLAGPSNIYMDDTFLAKCSLGNVGPDETFVCSLGVDPAVRVEYKPLKKFHAQSAGMFSCAQREVYEQNTKIVNGRQNAIHLLMEDQLPKSNEEKIVVTLIEPQISSTNQQTAATGGSGTVSSEVSGGSTEKTKAKVTNKNLVEWDLTLQPKEKLNVLFKYQLEYANDKEVTEYEKI